MIQKLFTGSNPKNKHVPSLWFKLYARQPLVFESGFTGFSYDEMEVLAVNCQPYEMVGPSGGVLRRWRGSAPM